MRKLLLALVIGVFVLPGLASAQYYVNMDMESDLALIHSGDTVCITVSFDHNIPCNPDMTLDVYIAGPYGGEILWYTNDFVMPLGFVSCTHCITIPGCGHYGDYTVTGYLWYQGDIVAEDSIVITYQE